MKVLSNLSQERITAEFKKIVAGKNAVSVIELMAKTGYLWEIVPELKDLLQPHNSPFHTETREGFENSIFAHTLIVFEQSVKRGNGLLVRLAALFHDIGKPAARENKGDHDRFVGHDMVGADMVRTIMKRMRFTNEETSFVVALVDNHMKVHNLPKMKRVASIRKFLAQPLFLEMVELGICDTLGTKNAGSPEPDLTTLLNAVAKLTKKYGRVLPEPLVNGRDLLNAGMKPGPNFKVVLERCFDHQLGNNVSKESLMKMALAMVSN